MMLRFRWDSLRRGDRVLVHDAGSADLGLRPAVVEFVDTTGSRPDSRCATPTGPMPAGSSGRAASRPMRTPSTTSPTAGGAPKHRPANRPNPLMRDFACEHCGSEVRFDAATCPVCSSMLGYVPEERTIRELLPTTNEAGYGIAGHATEYWRCLNAAWGCNWMLPAAGGARGAVRARSPADGRTTAGRTPSPRGRSPRRASGGWCTSSTACRLPVRPRTAGDAGRSRLRPRVPARAAGLDRPPRRRRHARPRGGRPGVPGRSAAAFGRAVPHAPRQPPSRDRPPLLAVPRRATRRPRALPRPVRRRARRLRPGAASATTPAPT